MVKDLTQKLAEQDQWKARNNNLTKAKRFDVVDFDGDKLFTISENLKTFHPNKINWETGNTKVFYLFQPKDQRRTITDMDYDWRKANWMDPNDYDAGCKK